MHEREPGADVHRAMSAQGVLVGVGMGGGALVSGGLVAWHPFRDSSALLLPIQVFVALCVVHLVATSVLLRETPRSDDGCGLGWPTPSARPPSWCATGSVW